MVCRLERCYAMYLLRLHTFMNRHFLLKLLHFECRMILYYLSYVGWNWPNGTSKTFQRFAHFQSFERSRENNSQAKKSYANWNVFIHHINRFGLCIWSFQDSRMDDSEMEWSTKFLGSFGLQWRNIHSLTIFLGMVSRSYPPQCDWRKICLSNSRHVALSKFWKKMQFKMGHVSFIIYRLIFMRAKI